MRKDANPTPEGYWSFAYLDSMNGEMLMRDILVAGKAYPAKSKHTKDIFRLLISAAPKMAKELTLLEGVVLLGRVLGWFKLEKEL